MKHIQWITMILISALLLGGCANTQEEDFGVTDSFMESVESDALENTEEPKEETPKEEEPKEEEPKEDTPKEEQPKEETPKEEEPKEDTPKEETPKEEEPSQEETPADPEEELPPITKEASGVAFTLLAQNVKHDGVQLAEKGDGVGNSLYNRLSRFRSLLQNHQPDVIFFQEARVGTLQFFETDDSYISQSYTTLWKWRWDELGPYNGGHQAEPLMYKTSRFKCVESGFFWLSETPNRPSKCYDVKADYGNIASWAILQDKATGVKVYFCSAHSPDPTDGGGEAAYKSMEQFFDQFRNLEEGIYGFMGGDLNIKYGSDHYEAIWDWDTIVDLRDMAHNMKADGLCEIGGDNGSIDRGFEEDTYDPTPGNDKQIDHILAKLDPHMAVDYWGFDYTRYSADGVQAGHISDHYGLIAKVRVETQVDYSRYQHQYRD